jgi:hypothetical protein
MLPTPGKCFRPEKAEAIRTLATKTKSAGQFLMFDIGTYRYGPVLRSKMVVRQILYSGKLDNINVLSTVPVAYY